MSIEEMAEQVLGRIEQTRLQWSKEMAEIHRILHRIEMKVVDLEVEMVCQEESADESRRAIMNKLTAIEIEVEED